MHVGLVHVVVYRAYHFFLISDSSSLPKSFNICSDQIPYLLSSYSNSKTLCKPFESANKPDDENNLLVEHGFALQVVLFGFVLNVATVQEWVEQS